MLILIDSDASLGGVILKNVAATDAAMAALVSVFDKLGPLIADQNAPTPDELASVATLVGCEVSAVPVLFGRVALARQARATFLQAAAGVTKKLGAT